MEVFTFAYITKYSIFNGWLSYGFTSNEAIKLVWYLFAPRKKNLLSQVLSLISNLSFFKNPDLYQYDIMSSLSHFQLLSMTVSSKDTCC